MSDEEKKYRYLQFPTCLLQETYKDPYQGIDLIINFGIVHFGKSIQINIEDVAKQLMYAWYRKPEMIQDSLSKMMQDYISLEEIILDEDYKGFSGPDFSPEGEMFSINELFKRDETFKDSATLRWQIEKAVSDGLQPIKIGSMDSVITGYNKGMAIQKGFETIYGLDCWSSCKTLMLCDFRDKQTDLDLFRCFLGIKSIIGQRDFNITHKSVILSRMFGCKSNKALLDFTKQKDIKKLYDKYNTRYWFDWLLSELETRGFITKVGYKRWGIFISTKYQDKDSLVEAVIKNHEKKNLASQEKQARDKLNSIYKRQHKDNIKTA